MISFCLTARPEASGQPSSRHVTGRSHFQASKIVAAYAVDRSGSKICRYIPPYKIRFRFLLFFETQNHDVFSCETSRQSLHSCTLFRYIMGDFGTKM